MNGEVVRPVWTPPPKPTPCSHRIYTYYKNLEYRGKVLTGSNFKDEQPFTRSINEFTNMHLTTLHKQLLMDVAGDTYYIAKPTIKNVDFSIETFENRPEPIGFDDPTFQQCLDRASYILHTQYGHLFKDCVSSPEELAEVIDYSKSSGWDGTHCGYSLKSELAKSQEFWDWLFTNKHLLQDPLWSVHPKKEFKLLADLLKNKIRLFTIPPFSLLYEQLRFGKKVSERMKNFKWSAFGFVPYHGGVNRLALKLLSKRIRVFYDISGWDKYLNLLERVYAIISNNVDFDKELLPNYMWCVKNTVEYFFKTPSGHVFLKRYGNPSGSGVTTRDNILAHIIIVASALMHAYYQKFNTLPTDEYVCEQLVFIFGDDSIMAVDEDFDFILKDDFLKHHFARFGLTLKYCYGGLDFPLDKMQFLGFTFRNIDGIWYPSYDADKLATSFLYNGVSSNNREAYISRAFTLMVMSYPTDHFSKFLDAWHDICDSLTLQQFDLTPVEISYISHRNVTVSEIRQLYIGFESCPLNKFVDEFCFFSSHWKEEEQI